MEPSLRLLASGMGWRQRCWHSRAGGEGVSHVGMPIACMAAPSAGLPETEQEEDQRPSLWRTDSSLPWRGKKKCFS